MVVEVPVFTLLLSTLLLQSSPTPEPAQPTPTSNTSRTWTGCVQAGSAPSTYRLNLEAPATMTTESGAAAAAGTQGDPYVQLVIGASKLDLTKHVGKRVRVTGRQLTDAEAEQEAARRPNRQEAAETAAGTGGTTQRHERYVRIQTVTPAEGECK
jgi:hypothetical protein